MKPFFLTRYARMERALDGYETVKMQVNIR
jgi:hypothetical protein